MFNVSENLIIEYKSFVAGALDSFWPLMAVIIGVFLAFAIANQTTWLIKKMK
jgi:hypothetical protein